MRDTALENAKKAEKQLQSQKEELQGLEDVKKEYKQVQQKLLENATDYQSKLSRLSRELEERIAGIKEESARL